MIRLLWIALLALLAACSSDDKTAGISTVETENAMLVIQVTGADSLPAANVLARMRAVRYVHDAGAADSAGGAVAEFATDSLGRIALAASAVESIGLDSVAVEILDGKYGAFDVIPLSTDAAAGDVDSVSLTLAKLGGFKGRISENALERYGDSVMVQVYGTDRVVAVDSNGEFVLEGLPPFEYAIRIVAGDSAVDAVGEVAAGEVSQLGVLLQNSIVIAADSLVSGWMETAREARAAGKTVVGFVHLDSSNFDFTAVREGGADVNVLGMEGKQIPFAVSYWDDSLQLAVVQLQLAAGVDSVRLAWGDGKTDSKNSGRVECSDLWKSVDAAVVQEQNMVSIIDFESGLAPNIREPAHVKDAYLIYLGDSVVSDPLPKNSADGVEADSARGGHVFHWSSEAPNPGGSWTSFVVEVCSPERPCNLEGIDSVVFDIRGDGFYSFALETNGWGDMDGKTIYLDTIATEKWLHKVITPADWDEADNKYGNIGWERIRGHVTHINISAFYTAELWIDDIKFYGVNLDDMRE